MSGRTRHLMFLVSALIVGVFLLWGLRGLPPFGHYHGVDGLALNTLAVPQRHVTDVIAAINFDYRGFDTIAEEFILFIAVAGTTLLLRTERAESDEEAPKADEVDRAARTSEAIQAFCLVLVAPVVVLGLYIVSHGTLTPGGGFQGGVILASAPLLIFLGGEYTTMRSLTPAERTEVADAIGAAGFVVIGLIGLVTGAAYLQDVLPLGPVGMLYSTGTIQLVNLSIGLEVGAGMLVVFSEYFRQVVQVRAGTQESQRERQDPQDESDRGRS